MKSILYSLAVSLLLAGSEARTFNSESNQQNTWSLAQQMATTSGNQSSVGNVTAGSSSQSFGPFSSSSQQSISSPQDVFNAINGINQQVAQAAAE